MGISDNVGNELISDCGGGGLVLHFMEIFLEKCNDE
jgi:hypothetical protein